MAVDKFRPLLSERDVAILLAGLDKLEPSPQQQALRKKLAVCQLKIEAGLVKPSARVAQETTGKNSLENDMGISEEEKAAWVQQELDRLLGPAATAPTTVVDSSIPVDLGNPVAAISSI